MGGRGDAGHEDSILSISGLESCEARDTLLSGVVIRFVEVITLSGEVMMPAALY